jgi:transposase-like protein
VLKIAGKKHYLWRAVDQHGVVLDVLVQSRREALANAMGDTRKRPNACCANC